MTASRVVARPGATTVVELYDQQDRGIDTQDLRELARFALAYADAAVEQHLRASGQITLDVTLVDADRMAELNREHMDAEGPTDVLAFPLDGPGEGHEGLPQFLGDVVLCPDVAASQAAAVGHSLQDELRLLLVHGILHLFGHDHAESEERAVMFGLTDEILAAYRAGIDGSPSGGGPGSPGERA